ncbi:MAG TPA: ABC transporter substrate-binding protein [Aquihabitans sp.]|nr:ABC transporter substrate-binding protein [Aquihabitans sp.]
MSPNPTPPGTAPDTGTTPTSTTPTSTTPASTTTTLRHRTRPIRSGRAPRRLGAVVAVAGLLLAACGSPPSSGGGGGGRDAEGAAADELPPCPLDALEEASEPVQVKLWFGGLVDPPVSVLEGMVKAFNESQDKVVVSADNQGNAYSEVMRKYQGASATPSQLPNLIYLEDTSLGEMVDKGQVLPAQSCMEADDYDLTQITPAARASYEVDDVLYPGYMNVSTPVVYFNKLHFEKAGLDPNDPPETLAEVEEYAQKIKDAGVAPKPMAFLANEWFLNSWIAGVGQDTVDNDNGRSAVPTEATFDTEPVQGALTQLADMNAAGLLNPFPVTDGSIDHYLSLVTEQSSMLIETSTASGTIAEVLGGDLTAEEAGIDFDAGAIDATKVVPGSGKFPGIEAPGKVYASGGAFYILNEGSPAQQAGAWKFLRFMLEDENAKTWHVEGGYLPVVKAVVDDPDVREFQDTALDGLLLKPAVEQLAAADPDQAGPLIGPYVEFQGEMRNALEGVLFSGADPKAAVSEAQENVTSLLQEYNGE